MLARSSPWNPVAAEVCVVALETASSPITQLRQRSLEKYFDKRRKILLKSYQERFLRLRSIQELQVELLNGLVVVVVVVRPHIEIFPIFK